MINQDADLQVFADLVIEVGPTVREFQDACGLSSSYVANYHLHALYKDGLINRRDGWLGHGRPWVLTPKGRERLRLLKEGAA